MTSVVISISQAKHPYQVDRYNLKHGTRYTKYHLARSLAAERRGWDYDWDDDVFSCFICKDTWMSIRDEREDHECEVHEFTLADYVPMKLQKPFDDDAGALFTPMVIDEQPLPVSPINFGTVNEAIKQSEQAAYKKQYVERQLDAYAMMSQWFKQNPEEAKFGDVIEVDGQLTFSNVHTDVFSPPRPATTEEQKEMDFANGEDAIVDSLQWQCENVATKMEEPVSKVREVENFTTPSRRKRINKKAAQTLNEQTWISFVNSVMKVIKKQNKQFEFVTKKAVSGCIKRVGYKPVVRLNVAHLKGKRLSQDIRVDEDQEDLIRKLAHHCSFNDTKIHTEVSRGCSGFVLNPNKLHQNARLKDSEIFIVRGAFDGYLVDAREYLRPQAKHAIVQYSDVASTFWKGFTDKFLECIPTDIDHTCAPSFSVKDCGEVAGIVCQTIMPCGKITCADCARQYNNFSKGEVRERLLSIFTVNEVKLRKQFPQFTHVIKFLEEYGELLNTVNTNLDGFSNIKRLAGDKTEAPFNHINRLNEILIKGASASSKEFIEATSVLLELTRFQMNRTDNIKKGNLAYFRNKISGKAHINPTLLCDNQLDQNGNFIWGQRGYHAKRFFNNFFETVDPTQGYEKYIIRRNPNGTRKLAIGNLIVSTNLERLRDQLKGERIEAEPLTDECVSKQNGNYAYPCCCVTHEDGTPVLSEIKMPTKNHLVIGNTGDSKFVDLPVEKNLNMYIAKEGYCYVNIFLAMAINVDEKDAKEFTKMVRDVAISKLGKWPSVLDLATICHLLIVFFPSVYNAELPRILVDHKTKTMHVIDSYGSLTTGYHVLKANSVAQFSRFAFNSLESELKHYRVGGTEFNGSSEYVGVQKLVRGIYKPKELKTILLNEPYLLILSTLSPGVLIALFNSGSLEVATRHLLHTKHDMATVSVMLTALAQKVSTAKLITQQIQVIEQHAADIIEVIANSPGDSTSKVLAMEVLIRLQARSDSDETLLGNGFMTLRQSTLNIMEKNYLQVLEDAWQELTWLEKLSAIYSAQQWRKRIPKPVKPESTADMGGRYDISFGSLREQAIAKLKQWFNDGCSYTSSKFSNMCLSVVNSMFAVAKYCIPDIFYFVNLLLVISLLLGISGRLNEFVQNHQENKRKAQMLERWDKEQAVVNLYQVLVSKIGKAPTKDEFIEFVSSTHPELIDVAKGLISDDVVEHQASKRKSEADLERIVAFVSLIMMLFDSEKSDCVFRVLNKLKSLVGTIDNEVYHQSLDDIQDTFDEKNLTIDFEVEGGELVHNDTTDSTFERWWANQLANGNTIPHYRTEGVFMEFTRQTAVKIANDIAHGDANDILLMGAVGSGKSTGLPFHLSKKGRVLLVEPTRPLAENVCKQLRQDPFYVNATLKMRGCSTFGSSPITIMTSGYAFHYLSNNTSNLQDFEFVIFDECHVSDAQAMAFRSLLSEYNFPGKIVKVSATPPGREFEFKTQHPVKLIVEESLSMQQFVSNLGSGANSDVIKCGNNFLIYVASYNEVDQLGKMLTDRKFKVTKVDGRTMKIGSVEIQTVGTDTCKHFVVATNIIENGVTLDVDVVVDFGMKVVPILDVDNRMIRYNKTSINFGERIQRLGRVGRHKPGTALRIGHTEKGLTEIPSVIATEAAFLCFTKGLPVMTQNVSTNLLSHCTVRQARTMLHFELHPFFMVNFVRFDGTMHQAVHSLLKQYKLRDSEIIMNKLAIPSSGTSSWIRATDYNRIGANFSADSKMRVSFYAKDIPEMLHERLWQAIQDHKSDIGFGRCTSVSACKIAYTLQTDVHSIQRTVKIIDKLIELELQKQEAFRNVTASSCSNSTYSLAAIANAIKAKYARDHTAENIAILQSAKAHIQEFANLSLDVGFRDMELQRLSKLVEDHGSLECVYHQSASSMRKHLRLKGQWDGSLITRDALIMIATLGGGAWMLYEHFINKFNEEVYHQAGRKNKRQQQKLKFRQARDNKYAREVYGDEATMEAHFGSAYTKKGKKGGTVKNLGKKSRRFINMYGYDPADFSFVRFLDPLTGYTLDENPIQDINIVQEHFTKIRMDMLGEGDLEPQHFSGNNIVEAYYVDDLTKKALKVDLTPHNPTRLGDHSASIAGFPEREGELRQTGAPIMVDPSRVPKQKEYEEGEAVHEGASMYRGMRDYNPIASAICYLENNSDGHIVHQYGLGYGGLIITNQHLFKRNNGSLTIRSHHGEFVVKNTTTLKLFPCEGRDVIIIQMPKDFPVFAQKLKFRTPVDSERVCMVGSNFQTKSISSTVSETSTTHHLANSHFWNHWIETKDGHCGFPIVSTKDGYILGLHSLSNTRNTKNYYASFPEDFEGSILKTSEQIEWVKHWKYNSDNVCWGKLDILASKPEGLFKVSKLVSDLEAEFVYEQSAHKKWMLDSLNGNLKAVASCPSKLVTSHVVKGKCPLFELYLQTHEEERKFFKPLMGAYDKSRLNKDAYIKDIMKYAKPIIVGDVDCNVFEQAVIGVIHMLERVGFTECNYITDEREIFGALNMKAAVGALYTGKKRDYFEAFTDGDREEIVKQSCLRVYTGKLGVWNGSLKAELRPIEKVLANKTRTFTAAPIDTLLAGKVCVDDFNNKFYSLNITAPWSVGMTKFYGGWDELLRKLPDGWVYCDADGSQFDSSLSPYLINAVLNIRLHFMEEWDIGVEMLKNLYTEIVYTPISTPDGTVVKKYKGNNSGQPSTVVDNTLMVIIAMFYTLLKLGIPLEDHDKICRYFVNGDDLLLSIKPEYEHLLDSFAELFGTLGLNYTFDSRTSKRTDLWFMSHQGMLVDNLYIPKLEQERIVSILEWDRSKEPHHRLEAICAAMIESWGYNDLTREIRKFYSWILDQAPYSEMAKNGKAPYIAETALRRLYTNIEPTEDELEVYTKLLMEIDYDEEDAWQVYHQNDEELDAGQKVAQATAEREKAEREREAANELSRTNQRRADEEEQNRINNAGRTNGDRDVNAGTSGTASIPRLKNLASKLTLPKVRGTVAVNLDHLIKYEPAQVDLSNTRSTKSQFESWHDGVMADYGVTPEQMAFLMGGLMVWCIENGTSPNINGMWVMMDGEEQVEYPIKPLIDHARPTFRQIMAHFSSLAEAYIEKRNFKEPYMPRYGIQRNLRDMSLARYAFDFYEITSKTPARAKEAHFQMKAAALVNTSTKLFGLDGNVATKEEDTERHTAGDVNQNLHTMMGVRGAN
ncbi:polyprotein [Marigold mosaic virus]|uniref:Genome polyprotein n=1 Tax=Marigold mosaic virus TaxID=2820912 RepID=A0A8A5NZ45_9POTV|nr:polyprotein [Marigold mosaic virus]QTG10435.1 polyprotein [Marigold mosaic virus]